MSIVPDEYVIRVLFDNVFANTCINDIQTEKNPQKVVHNFSNRRLFIYSLNHFPAKPLGKLLCNPLGKLLGKPLGKLLGKPLGKLLGKPLGKLLGKPLGKLAQHCFLYVTYIVYTVPSFIWIFLISSKTPLKRGVGRENEETNREGND